MKKATLLLAPLLLVMMLHAQTQKIADEPEVIEISIDNIKSGSTLRQYSKPGAPIDMHYDSEKVDVNESSDINITLETTVQNGGLSINITFDENLTLISDMEENLTFELQSPQTKYAINFQVKSEKAGLYYIRLLTKVDKGFGLKLRSFAVPVYIGKDLKPIVKSNAIMKALSGENISVTKAIETIEVIKDK